MEVFQVHLRLPHMVRTYKLCESSLIIIFVFYVDTETSSPSGQKRKGVYLDFFYEREAMLLSSI